MNDTGSNHDHDLQLLLERFSALHREGRLDQAAETLERALAVMTGRSTTRKGASPRSDLSSPSYEATAQTDEGLTQGTDGLGLSRDGFGTAEKASGRRVSTGGTLASTEDGVEFDAHRGVPDRNDVSSGIGAGDVNDGSRGTIEEPGDGFSSRGDGFGLIAMEEVGGGEGGDQLHAIAGVMNDLACTYQQASPPSCHHAMLLCLSSFLKRDGCTPTIVIVQVIFSFSFSRRCHKPVS